MFESKASILNENIESFSSFFDTNLKRKTAEFIFFLISGFGGGFIDPPTFDVFDDSKVSSGTSIDQSIDTILSFEET